MEKTVSKLTVFFEEPFWVGVCEREADGRYEVCKITFGAEPKDYEVYDFMLKNYDRLHFNPALEVGVVADKCINPKWMHPQNCPEYSCVKAVKNFCLHSVYSFYCSLLLS